MPAFITGKRADFQCCFCCGGACGVDRLLGRRCQMYRRRH